MLGPAFIDHPAEKGECWKLCQLMNRFYGAAGLDRATSHSGRRWFITKLANSGVGTKVIMTLAGHKHMTTTQRYIDVRDDMMKAAVELL